MRLFSKVGELKQLDVDQKVAVLLKVVTKPAVTVTRAGKKYVSFLCTDKDAVDVFDPSFEPIIVFIWINTRKVTDFEVANVGDYFFCRDGLISLKYNSDEYQVKAFDNSLITFYDVLPSWAKSQ